jgi:sec-independent protein translocase protein TatA
MPNVGPMEWLLILLVLLLFGPGRLVGLGIATGKTLREFRRALSEDDVIAQGASPRAQSEDDRLQTDNRLGGGWIMKRFAALVALGALLLTVAPHALASADPEGPHLYKNIDVAPSGAIVSQSDGSMGYTVDIGASPSQVTTVDDEHPNVDVN